MYCTSIEDVLKMKIELYALFWKYDEKNVLSLEYLSSTIKKDEGGSYQKKLQTHSNSKTNHVSFKTIKD